MTISVSELFALSQGAKCQGPDECHWCGSPCERVWMHDDAPPLLGYPRTSGAKRPANCYVCVGCFLFRKPRVTVEFLSGGYLDGQTPAKHAWWITEQGAWALRKEDYPALWRLLVKPPLRFTLALLTDDSARRSVPIHLLVANDHFEVKGDTPLAFTINGVAHTYTTYELGEVLKHGGDGGKGPGERALRTLLGPYPEDVTKKSAGGRPKADPDRENGTRKLVTPKSGS